MKFSLLLSSFIWMLSCACNSKRSSSDNNTTTKRIKDREASSSELIFEQKCAPCHGHDGTAGIAGAANLQAGESNIPSITKMIAEGKGRMPSFSSELTKEEIAGITTYVLALRK